MATPTRSWQMTEPASPLQLRETDAPDPGPGDVLLEVHGCGVCHTDLGFLHGGVRTRKPLPLTLGHEISGTVLAMGPEANLVSGQGLSLGDPVIVPAVLPCGSCRMCRAGRENVCLEQRMPGNDIDGGFATHVTVPAAFLIPVGAVPEGHELAHLSVVADAVTTPYQALVRARLTEGDPVVVIGVGGIGIYGVQIAAALGASVIAVDLDPDRAERAREFGAAGAVGTRGLDDAGARNAVRETARSLGWDRTGWKVFEMSGSGGGQRLAYSLLTHAGILGVVGFTMEKVEIRLSNLMAFDAEAFGSWGCSPRHYPAVLDLIRAGAVRVTPFVTFHPLAEVNAVLDRAHRGELFDRAVLVP